MNCLFLTKVKVNTQAGGNFDLNSDNRTFVLSF